MFLLLIPCLLVTERVCCEPYDVFLVCSGSERDVEISAMDDKLGGSLRCFLDAHELSPSGGSPIKVMRFALETCRHSVVVISPSFLEKEDRKTEMKY